MVRCTGIPKPKCEHPCEWTKGKGCNKAAKNKSAVIEKVKTPTPSPKKIYAFIGFKDDGLKEQVEKNGSTVTYGIKDNTNYVIYKVDKRILNTIENLTIPKMLINDFVTKYGYESKKLVKAIRAPKAKAKTPSPPPKVKTPSPVIKFSDLFTRRKPFAKEDYETNLKITDNLYNYSDLMYKKYWIKRILDHAVGAVKGIFITVKENKIKHVITQLFYSFDKDTFIIPLRVKNEEDPSKYDLYGIEFTYDPEKKYKIKINKDALVLLEEYEAGDDILDSLVDDFPDIIQIAAK
jgi:hypothetical protein